jgi:hypothetical protein
VSRLVEFAERAIATRVGLRKALLVTPRTAVRVGRERLAVLRDQASAGGIDEEIVEEVRRRGGAIPIAIFRGRGDTGEGSWGFSEDLTDSEVEELGYRLVVSQQATYRRLLENGVFLIVHVECGRRETPALKAGTSRRLSELQQELADSTQTRRLDPVRRLDIWMLQNLTFFFNLELDAVLGDVLADKIPLLEQRIPKIKAMLAALPR